jgi:hypothetical protein
VSRPGEDAQEAREQFRQIREERSRFADIRKRLGLTGVSEFSDEQKLSIYREHKRLEHAVTPAPSDGVYEFSLRVQEGDGYEVIGIGTSSGDSTDESKKSSFNTCPICLAVDSRIDTTQGPIPVSDIQEVMLVWTVGDDGERVALPVIAVGNTPAHESHDIVNVRLTDGRTLKASPGHPTADAIPLGEYRPGDMLDGTCVASVTLSPYREQRKYDLLLADGKGLHWVDGVLLRSTIQADDGLTKLNGGYRRCRIPMRLHWSPGKKAGETVNPIMTPNSGGCSTE